MGILLNFSLLLNKTKNTFRWLCNIDDLFAHFFFYLKMICGSHDNPKGLVSGGRGFSVSGERPTFVARVQTGSAADQAGLLTGDRIIRVDGVDVSGCTSDALARIIRSLNLFRSLID